MSFGKQAPGGTRTVYGTVAGIISLGPLDFVWGIMVNNVLAWPTISIWDSKSWQANQQVLYIDGNVYQTLESTTEDPPAAPWTLVASPWVAGTYPPGSVVIRGGYLWGTAGSNSLAPPASPSAPGATGTGRGLGGAVVVNGWALIGRPATWATSAEHSAGDIVAWKGRVYRTPSNTTHEPPASPWVLWRQPRATVTNPYKLTIADGGDAYLYWGTDDQTLDVTGEATLAALDHPAYRYRAVLVLKDFQFGVETETPPDIQVLGGRTPIQTLITGTAAALDADWQANPWCVLAELLTHPVIGLGLPDSFFDATTWQAEADRCLAKHGLYYISPLYTSLIKVRDLVADLMGYPDAFVFWNTLGVLQAGHWPHGEDAPTFDNTNTINRDVLVAELSGGSEGWGGTANSVELGYSDIQAAFKNRSVIAPNLFNRTIIKRLLAVKVDRPHIVRTQQALAWATEMAKLSGDRFSTNTSEARAERVSGIGPGSLFLVTDDVLQTSEVHRCNQRILSAPPKGTITLKHQLERGVSPEPYAPTPDLTTPPTGEAPAPIQDFQFVQLPFALGGGANRLACLASRRDNVSNNLQFWFQQADLGSFQLLGTGRHFGVAGLIGESINTAHTTDTIATVTQGNTYDLTLGNIWAVSVLYNTGGGTPATPATEGDDYAIDYANGTIQIVTGGAITTASSVAASYASGVLTIPDADIPAGDIEAISTSQTQDQILDNTLLVFLFQAADPSLFEIATVSEVTAGGGGYRLALKRAQYGSLMGGDGSHVFTTSDLAVVIYRADIVPLAHASFPALQEASSVANFILSPGSPYGQASLDDIYDPVSNPNGLATSCQYTFENIYAPQVDWISQKSNNVDIASFATAVTATDVIEVAFTLTDTNNDLVDAVFVAVNGSNRIEMWSQVFTPSRIQSGVATFSLPDGTWLFSMILRDLSGNVKEYIMTAVGGGPAVSLIVDSMAGTPDAATAAPIISPASATYTHAISLSITCPTAGATIKYAIVAYGAAQPSIPFATTYTAPVGLLGIVGAKRTVYAYATHSGLLDSAVIRSNYIRA